MEATATAPKAEEFLGHSLSWQRANLKIVDKASNLIPLSHNIAQMKVHNAMRLQQLAGLPVMLVILKARQEGVSTFIESCIFENINRKENRHGCIASMDQDSTNKVFRMCEIFQDEMPTAKKRATDRASAKEIRFSEPHRSSMLCQTAGKKALGRGGTTQYVHATEVAFWANAKIQLLGLLNEVPEMVPDTMIVLESTANGVGGAFHDEYWKAVKRLRANSKNYTGYLPVFLPWQIFPEYSTPLPKEWKGELRIDPLVKSYFDERKAAGITFTPEQMYFAALKIQNRCGGDIELFKQEYPSTAKEAFLSSGRMVFKVLMLDIMEQRCCPPKANIEFYMEETKVKYRHVNRTENCWAVWKFPIKNHSYVVFGDVAEGLMSDPKDAKSDPDRSVAVVLDRNLFDTPMVYYGRPDTIDFGDQMLMASKFFHYAWSSPEVNSIGQSILDTYKRDGYEFIYNREHKEETEVTVDSDKLGWKTTTKTRKPMIADMQQVVNEGELTIYDVRIIDEMRKFIWNMQGKPEGMAGETDDCVIAICGAVQLYKRCPAQEDFSWTKPEQVAERDVNLTAVGGAVDFDEDDDPDDLMYEDMSGFE
jgi:hypothetical protein